MAVDKLHSKTESELKSLLLDCSKELFNLRFQTVSGELEKTSRIREVKKNVARIKTALNVLNTASLSSLTKDKKEA